MSGIAHSVKKVFSKVWDFVRPIVEIVAVCAAIYFTAGLALSAFPATAGFAAALPGFAADGVAGAGIFSTAASSIGLGGGLAAGAAADGAIVGVGAAAAGTAATDAAGVAASAGATAETAEVADLAAPIASNVAAASTTGAAVASAAPGVAAGAAGTGAGAAGMSLTDKLMLASVGTNAISGFLAPSPADIQKAKNGWYGAFYGADSSGKSSPAPDMDMGPQTEPGRTYGQAPSAQPSLIPATSTPPPVMADSSKPNMGAGANLGSGPNLGTTSLIPGIPQIPRVG